MIGFPFGAIPAGGAEIPTFLSYVLERRLSKRPEEFGKGAIEGLAGPEATSSASSAGTLTSMLTLGLPTTATAAVMLAAFQQFGIQPGPLLFQRESQLVWTIIASLFIGLVLLLVLNLPLAPIWAKLLRIPRPYLYAGILFFACVGAYAASGQAIDLIVLLVIGVIGFFMRRYGLPVLPAVLGVILGSDAELQLRRSLQIADGDWTTLVSTPFAVVVYLVIIALLVFPAGRALAKRRAETEEPVAH
jgi:putative tricarboxylic transport membrane protein